MSVIKLSRHCLPKNNYSYVLVVASESESIIRIFRPRGYKTLIMLNTAEYEI